MVRPPPIHSPRLAVDQASHPVIVPAASDAVLQTRVYPHPPAILALARLLGRQVAEEIQSIEWQRTLDTARLDASKGDQTAVDQIRPSQIGAVHMERERRQ